MEASTLNLSIEPSKESAGEPAPPVPPNSLLTVKQAAVKLNVYPGTIMKWIREGRIRHARLGRAIRIQSDWLDEFVEQNTRYEVTAEGGRSRI